MRTTILFTFVLLVKFSLGYDYRTMNWNDEEFRMFPYPVYYYEEAVHPNYTLELFQDSLEDGQYILFNDNEFRNIDCLIGVKDANVTFVIKVNGDGTCTRTKLDTKTIIHYDAQYRRTLEYSLDYDRLINAWHQNGQQMVQDGEGSFAYYYPDGSLKTQGFISNGKYHGTYMEFYANGQIKEQGAYKQGKKSSKWWFWDHKGKLLRTEVWENGARVSSETQG